MRVSVSIATHNRLDELRRTCEVLHQLDPPPDEIIICADRCTDGTAAFIRKAYPKVRFFENEVARGSIYVRDFIIRQATGDILLTLDDDSYPIEQDFITHLRDLFRDHPEIGVASFPQRTEEFPETLDQKDFGPARYVSHYINAASAVRRSVYLELEGWTVDFEHMYDEPDYSLQCLQHGYHTYHATHLTIRHHWSGRNRSELANHHRHARNEQASLWKRCPLPYAPLVSVYRALSQFKFAATRGVDWFVQEPRWWFQFIKRWPGILRQRNPVSWSVYRQWLRLIKNPIYQENDWKERFPRSSPLNG
ncbi:MAG: glycosyltransferase [Verrucomicrobiota bacterium]